MSVVGCIAQDLAGKLVGDALKAGLGLLESLFFGAEEAAAPPPPTNAVTVTHQIKHKSFVAALAGAIIGAAVTALATAAIVALGALTFGAGLVVGIIVGAVVGYAVDKAVSWIDSRLPAEHGPVLPPSSPNVRIAGLPAARAGIDTVGCTRHSTPPLIAEGSKTVRVNGHPLARVDDRTACGATLKQGVDTVLAGGEKDRVVEVGEEFLWWQRALITAVDFLIPPSNGVKGIFKSLKSLAKTGIKKGLKLLSKSLQKAFKAGYKAAAKAFQHLKSGQFKKFGNALRSIVSGMCKESDFSNKKRTKNSDPSKTKPKPKNSKNKPKSKNRKNKPKSKNRKNKPKSKNRKNKPKSKNH
ncbi:MAG TPA: PAAR domain-containing protein, partial [Nannocystaceae bacterium]|nr:PAAR domain-containing protein [Nannocystaceae bacterium]